MIVATVSPATLALIAVVILGINVAVLVLTLGMLWKAAAAARETADGLHELIAVTRGEATRLNESIRSLVNDEQ